MAELGVQGFLTLDAYPMLRDDLEGMVRAALAERGVSNPRIEWSKEWWYPHHDPARFCSLRGDCDISAHWHGSVQQVWECNAWGDTDG